MTFGANYISSDMSWRLPLILQAVPAGLVIFSVWLLPESPRCVCRRLSRVERRWRLTFMRSLPSAAGSSCAAGKRRRGPSSSSVRPGRSSSTRSRRAGLLADHRPAARAPRQTTAATTPTRRSSSSSGQSSTRASSSTAPTRCVVLSSIRGTSCGPALTHFPCLAGLVGLPAALCDQERSYVAPRLL